MLPTNCLTLMTRALRAVVEVSDSQVILLVISEALGAAAHELSDSDDRILLSHCGWCGGVNGGV